VGQAKSGPVGSLAWLPVAPTEGLFMTVKICDDLMTLEVNGTIIARAERLPGGWWEVNNWPRFFDRNQAITALTVVVGPASGTTALDRCGSWDYSVGPLLSLAPPPEISRSESAL
jgi:hypothetical protein